MIGYFQYRLRELLVWLGIPFLGAVAGERFSWGPVLIIFGVSMVFAMAHVLLINDWGDLKKNPLEKKRFSSAVSMTIFRSRLLTLAIIAFVVSFFLYAKLVPVGFLLFFAVSGFTLSLLYSHPKTHFKESILGATLLHFLGGVLQFMLGYMVFSKVWFKGILLGSFFSLIFVAGHLVHECIDIEDDKKGDIKTRATRFGVRSVLQASLVFFITAHVFLAIITVVGITNWKINFIFFLPMVVHFIFLNRLRQYITLENKDIKNYRTYYRLAYACSSGIFFFFR